MATPETRTTVVRTRDLDLGGRSKLRACLTLNENGEPESLILSRGFGNGPAFHRPGWEPLPLHLPPSVIPELIQALQELHPEPEEKA